MDLKKKLAETKEKIKENAPVIAGAFAIGYAVMSTAYVLEKRKLKLDVTRDDLEVLKDKDCSLTYSIDGSDYTLSYRGNTPKR